MEEKHFLQLNDITSYRKSLSLSNYIWDIVIQWESFAKYSLGKQFVEAVDSISANIAEGFGRYTKNDKIHFYYYSLGSVKESNDWNLKANMRKLTSKEQFTHTLVNLNELDKDIRHLINFTRNRLKK